MNNTQKGLQENLLMNNEQYSNIFKIKRAVDWNKINRNFEDISLKENLNPDQVEMYIKLLVLFYNFKTNMTTSSFFEEIKGNNKNALKYKLFAGSYIDVIKRKIEIFEEFYTYAEDNNLSNEFKLEGELLKDEEFDYSNVCNSNRSVGII